MYAAGIKRRKLKKQQWEARLASEEAILTLGIYWGMRMKVFVTVTIVIVVLGWIGWDRILEYLGGAIGELQGKGPGNPWWLLFLLGLLNPEARVVFTPSGVFIFEKNWRKPFGRYDILPYGGGVRLKLIRRPRDGEFGKVFAAELDTRDRHWRLAPETPLDESEARLAIDRLTKLLPVQLRSE